MDQTAVGGVDMIVGVRFSGPRSLWEDLVSQWAEDILQKSKAAGLDVDSDNYHLACISLPCGEKLRIKSVDDLPLKNVPCPCGNPGHWSVLFSDKEEHRGD